MPSFHRYHALLIALGLCTTVPTGFAQEPKTASVAVSTIVTERKPVSRDVEFVGRVEATEQVEVRARVKGFLEEVLFEEGALVKAGDPLYTIEKDLFEADLVKAQGNLDRSRATLTLATLQRQRAQELLDKKAGTVVARDQAVAAELNARGSLLTDQADLNTAKINMGYTDITSPINGRVGRTNVTKGNVVGPESGPLTVIVSQDPIYVTFPVSYRNIMIARDRGNLKDPSHFKVRVRFADGTFYEDAGRIDFLDVKVNRSTDSVIARAVMPNAAGKLVDGQLVRVAIETATPEERVLVPQSALLADQSGTYVMIVTDGKAAVQRIKILSESGSNAIVESGLSGGEQVIVEGLQRVRPGTPVTPAPTMRPAGAN